MPRLFWRFDFQRITDDFGVIVFSLLAWYRAKPVSKVLRARVIRTCQVAWSG